MAKIFFTWLNMIEGVGTNTRIRRGKKPKMHPKSDLSIIVAL